MRRVPENDGSIDYEERAGDASIRVAIAIAGGVAESVSSLRDDAALVHAPVANATNKRATIAGLLMADTGTWS